MKNNSMMINFLLVAGSLCAQQVQIEDKIFLDVRADINTQHPQTGKTSLMIAIEYAPSCVPCLLSNGASLDKVDHDGNTAVHYAVLSFRYEILDVLLRTYEQREKEEGGNFAKGHICSVHNNEGKTPFLLAAFLGDVRALEIILYYYPWAINDRDYECNGALHVLWAGDSEQCDDEKSVRYERASKLLIERAPLLVKAVNKYGITPGDMLFYGDAASRYISKNKCLSLAERCALL